MLLKHKRTIIVSIILSIVLSMSAFVVLAGQLVISGELTQDSPAWSRPLAPGDAGGSYNTVDNCSFRQMYTDVSVPYETHAFRVTQGGYYDFNLQAGSSGTDFHLVLYNSTYPFTGNGLGPCVANVDDSNLGSCCPQMRVYLETDTTYTIVVTTYDNFEYGPYDLVISGPGDVVQSTYFADGRINFLDAATPIVVYPDDDGGIDVYSDEGVRLFYVSSDVLNLGGTCPAENTVLYTHDSPYVIVSQLPDCSIQINAAMYNGKTYVLAFTDFGSYQSWEIE